MDEFPERLHHPKESELLFPQVRECCPALAATLDRLDADPARGAAAIRQLGVFRPLFSQIVRAAAAPVGLGSPGRDALNCGAMPKPPPPPLKAMILAAGRGERMRPLTDQTPKPLLPVAGRPMIEWHLQALAAAGVREVVINTAWLEDQFPSALGDGSRWGLRIHYSHEGRDHGGALETAGGIAKALPALGDCFWLVSGDIVAPGFGFDAAQGQRFADGDDDAHLWLVPNPDFHAAGDFALAAGRVTRPPAGQPRPLTYANLALVRRRLVAGVVPGQRAALGPLLFDSAAAGRLGGELLTGEWHNLGTPAQWAALAPASAPQPGQARA